MCLLFVVDPLKSPTPGALEYWLAHIPLKPFIILCYNKIDLLPEPVTWKKYPSFSTPLAQRPRMQSEVPQDFIEQLRAKSSDLFEIACSAKTGQGVEELKALMWEIADHLAK
jgi:hypothetical protein